MPAAPTRTGGTLVQRSVYSRLVEGRNPDSTSLAALKRDIARDLTQLLNSRRIPREDLIAGFPQAADSILCYGIPDLLSFGAASVEHQYTVRALVEAAVERFETRLGLVSVELEPVDLHHKSIRFRISAKLQVPPFVEQVAFDADIDVGHHDCVVKEG